jgi:APA family basic amino acid/polyamine antiporter
MLSFTIAHAAVIQLRRRRDIDAVEFRPKPNVLVGGVSWPLFAIFGGLGTGIAWLVVVEQDAPTRYAGLGWLVLGFVFYWQFRRRAVHAPLTATVRAPVVIGPAAALEYRNILVPISPGDPSDEAMDVACRLATERGATIVAVTVVEVPLELSLETDLPEQVDEANHQLDEARAIGESYGLRVVGRIVRARSAGRAIVDEAARRGSEIIVMGAPRRSRPTRRSDIFGGTADFVLKHAPTRVMVAASRSAA